MNNNVIPIISAEAQRLAQRLSEVQPGEVVTYCELTTLIGLDVQTRGRGLLATARKHVLRDQQLVFEPIRNEGMKCLTDEEIAASGASHLRRIHNASRRGVKKLSAVKNFAQLTPVQQLRHNTSMTLLATFFEVSRAKNMQRVEHVVQHAGRALPLQETLKVFGLV